MDKKELGKKGEELAVELLKAKGYEIIERNYHYGYGEIDIIAKDPNDSFTVFIEVKTRQNLEFGEAEYAITKTKQKQIRKMAELYLYDKGITEIDCRFDVVAVLYKEKTKSIVNHYENAFI
jgi:putative endonuclease